MANPKHLEIARQGRDAWNKWRAENPNEPADFSDTDFTLPENQNISFAGFEFGDLPREWKCGGLFKSAKFGDNTNFEGATFGKYANFENATFGDKARFDLAKFDHGASFDRALFGNEARFDGVTFEGIAGFNETRFESPPCFASVKNPKNLSFVDTEFWAQERTIRSTSDRRIITNLRHLRGIANEIHAPDIERNLFIMERQAERGVLLKSWLDSWERDKQKNWWTSNWGARLIGWWKPLAVTVLLFLYWALSNCGRSMILPFLWCVLLNGLGFFGLYWWFADKPNFDSIASITLVNLLPIGTFAKPAMETTAICLFAYGVVPWQVHGVAILQSIVNAVLVFLLALALRNHFKVK